VRRFLCEEKKKRRSVQWRPNSVSRGKRMHRGKSRVWNMKWGIGVLEMGAFRKTNETKQH